MGGKESPQEDIIEKVKFDLNILVCGNYIEKDIENKVGRFEKLDHNKGEPYLKKGTHKNIPGWNYYLFSQDKDIGINTYNFIEDSIIKKDYKNIILFYSGLQEFSYKNLIEFYEQKADTYHSNILIIIQNGERFDSKSLDSKRINKNLIKVLEISNEIDIYIHLIKVSAYYNQLGDEIGFPKNILNKELLDKDNQLLLKYGFTFNILLCGKPGGGKSTLINRILGKQKSYAGKGSSSLTERIIKYISDKYPIAIYDTPGIENKEDIERIQKLIKQKNKSLNEEKNKIHFVFYILNTKGERTITDYEYEFIKSLLNQDMDLYFIVTHAETEENAKDFMGALEANIKQFFDKDKKDKDERIINLKNNIFPVELIEDKNYKKFGLNKVFTTLYNKYIVYKNNQEITAKNITQINSIFLGDIKTKDDLKKKLTALSQRVKANFKILASTLEDSPSVKGTSNLSTAVIKIISKIYNYIISTEDCLQYIQSHGYTNEYHQTDSIGRIIEKILATIFYANGPAAKEVESLACSLIEEYNLKLKEDRKFYSFLNMYNRSINFAIDSLQNIQD